MADEYQTGASKHGMPAAEGGMQSPGPASSPPKARLKRYFLTGLLIWVPLAITAWVLHLLVSTMDQTLNLLPGNLRESLPFSIPGMGVVLTLLVVVATGLMATNFIGARMVLWWEALLRRIPFVSSIYNSVKQVSDTLFSSSGQAFRKALLVQYPRQGSWTIAFLTGTPGGSVREYLHGDYVSVYVPTTPNPTSGFFLMLPKSDVIELDMSVDEALKYIISMGVVAPDPHHGPGAKRAHGPGGRPAASAGRTNASTGAEPPASA